MARRKLRFDADRLEDAAINAGLSPRDLARRTGIDPKTVNRVMSGEQTPRWSTVKALATECDIPPRALWREEPAD